MKFYLDDPIPYGFDGEETDNNDEWLSVLQKYTEAAGGTIERVSGRRNGAGTPYDFILTVPDEPSAVEFFRRFLFSGGDPGPAGFTANDFAKYSIEQME